MKVSMEAMEDPMAAVQASMEAIEASVEFGKASMKGMEASIDDFTNFHKCRYRWPFVGGAGYFCLIFEVFGMAQEFWINFLRVDPWVDYHPIV